MNMYTKKALTFLMATLSVFSLAGIASAECDACKGERSKAACECHDKKECECKKDCTCEACKEKKCGSTEGAHTKHESCGEQHEHKEK